MALRDLIPYRRRHVKEYVTPLFGDLVWRCHFCDRERFDQFIRVVLATRSIRGVQVTHSRRYCIDTEECREAAYRWQGEADDFGRMPRDLPAQA